MEDEVLMLWITRRFFSPAILKDGSKFASAAFSHLTCGASSELYPRFLALHLPTLQNVCSYELGSCPPLIIPRTSLLLFIYQLMYRPTSGLKREQLLCELNEQTTVKKKQSRFRLRFF